MKIIVGLGNPGKRYEWTRHNAGFLVLNELKTRMINGQYSTSNQDSNLNFQMKNKLGAEVVRVDDLVLVKPQRFMNNSGEVVAKILAYFGRNKFQDPKSKNLDLWVVHDDLDVKLGEYKIQMGKGPKVHNGVNSIETALKTKDFWRVRVGIENRLQGTGYKEQGENYVLKPFLKEERGMVDEVVSKIATELYERCV